MWMIARYPPLSDGMQRIIYERCFLPEDIARFRRVHRFAAIDENNMALWPSGKAADSDSAQQGSNP
jgi:hypothetical protein